MANRATDGFLARRRRVEGQLHLDSDAGHPPWRRLAHRPRAVHGRPLAAGAETAAGIVSNARREGRDEEIGRCRTCILASCIARLINDQLVSANRDPMTIATYADDIQLHGTLT